jgi:signal transduction histidine kinase
MTVVRDLQPVVVIGDPGRLHQIATNLLTNASKFTPVGGQVHIHTGPGPDNTAQLEVSDTGPGLAPDELPCVFQRFWRGRHLTSTTGTGIGLAIVAELTRAHHGTVGAASPPNGGAQFSVNLPRPGVARHPDHA